MPDLSGYRAAASVYDEVSKAGFQIGADMRQQKLNNLILEAEASGMTAGATYDKDGNLVPLTNLDLDAAIEEQVIGAGEKKALRDAYRQSAIKTYQASISTDALKMASQALTMNPSNPNAIRGNLRGYLEGLDVPEEVMQFVKPSIVRAFTSVESQAFANQQKESRELTKQKNLENINNIAEEMATLTAKGSGNNPAVAAGHNKMLNELSNDMEGSFDALRTIGYNDTEIQNIREGVAVKIAARSAQAHVERIYQSTGSTIQALAEAEKARNEFLDDPNIDADKMYGVMVNRISELSKIDNLILQEQVKSNSDNYDSARLGIAIGDITNVDQILNEDVDDGQKASLIGMLGEVSRGGLSAKAAIEKSELAYRKEQFDKLMTPFIDEFGDQSERERNSVIITRMYQAGLLPAAKFNEFVKQSNSIVKDAIKRGADAQFALLESNMTEQSGYAMDPATLREMTPQLIANGYVGDTTKGAKYSMESWETKIGTYASKRSNWLRAEKKKQDSVIRVKNGEGSAADHKVASEVNPVQLEADANGQTIYHSDPMVRDANFEKAVKYSLAYKVLHPDVKNALMGLSSSPNEDLFSARVQLFDKLFDSISRGAVREGVTDYAMGPLHALNLMNKSGVNTLDFEVARILGFEKYRDYTAVSNTINPERVTNHLDAKYGGLSEAIDANFKEAVSISVLDTIYYSLLSTFNAGPYFDSKTELAIKNLASNVPDGGDLEDAYIGDPRVKRVIELSVLQKMSAVAGTGIKIDDEFLRLAIRHSAAELSNDIGVSVNSAGESYLAYKPWVQSARATMGDRAELFPDVSGAVFMDIKTKYLTQFASSLVDPEIRELLESGDGIIDLAANPLAGPEQTYRVVVRDPDTGKATTIMPFYRYDYNYSIQNGAYQAAIKRMQNDSIAQLMSNISFGLTTPFSMRNKIESVIDDLDKENEFESFAEFVSYINSVANPFSDAMPNKKYDARDVEILRDFIAGGMRDEEAYMRKLERLYNE